MNAAGQGMARDELVLGLPDLTRARAPFELLPVEELLARAASSEWLSARAFVREELTRHNGDNRTKVPLSELELHPLAAAEMRAAREQVVMPIRSRRRRTYHGYDLEGTMAWGLVRLEQRIAPERTYRHPGLWWCFAEAPEAGIGSAYAIVFTEEEGTRRVLAWRRHELMSCVDPEPFAAELVRAGSQQCVPRADSQYSWQRERYSTREAASASESARRIATLCEGGRAAVLDDGPHAVRVAVEMAKLRDLLDEGPADETVWAHPCDELASVSFAAAVTQIRACVSETIALRPCLGDEVRFGRRELAGSGPLGGPERPR